MKATIYIDGASRGNPGPASCAAVVLAEGFPERELGLFLGSATNNIAEYSGLLLGLQEAKDMGAEEVLVFSDSNLCVQQVKGKFKVSSPNLIPLYNKAKRALRHFSKWEITHIPREQNKRADSLTNKVLDLYELMSRA
ncbi:MAG TPA: ribonuclease HI family protein [Firmicutes bacterium]|jgi:ribonuclease HI|nr:ribonuclease HI family protein [Bacillota bacterium]